MEHQDYSSLIKKGKEAGLSGHYEEAVSFFMEAKRLEPDRAEAHYHLSIAFGMLGRYEKAQAASSEAVRLTPTDVEPRPDADPDLAEVAQPDVDLALAEVAQSDVDSALAEVAQLEETEQKDVPLLIKEGQEALLSENHEEAVAAYKEVVSLDPDNADAHFEMGKALGELGRHGEALETYEEAIRLKPEHEEAYVRSGACLMVLGRHEEAVEAYEEAIRLEPDLVEAHRGMGMAYRALARYDEAVAAFNEAVRIKPDDDEARRGLEWVSEERPPPEEVVEVVAEKPKHPKAPSRGPKILVAIVLVLVTSVLAYLVSTIGVGTFTEKVRGWFPFLKKLF